MNAQNNIPLVTVATEIGVAAGDLAARLGDAVVIDAVTGLRSLPADRCRMIVEGHRAAVKAARDQAAAERAAARKVPNPARERVRAIAQAQDRFDGSDLPPLAVLMAGDPDARFHRTARVLDGMLEGDLRIHKYNDDRRAR